MKRKLIVLLTFTLIGIGRCGNECFDLRPDYCGIDGKTATIGLVNNQPRIISSR